MRYGLPIMLLLTSIAAAPAYSDELTIPAPIPEGEASAEAMPVPVPEVDTGSQPMQVPEMPATSAVDMPGRGMSMEAVEAKFGAPQRKHDAVGIPPISRWDYPGYSVFFENNLVLHSVSRQDP